MEVNQQYAVRSATALSKRFKCVGKFRVTPELLESLTSSIPQPRPSSDSLSNKGTESLPRLSFAFREGSNGTSSRLTGSESVLRAGEKRFQVRVNREDSNVCRCLSLQRDEEECFSKRESSEHPRFSFYEMGGIPHKFIVQRALDEKEHDRIKTRQSTHEAEFRSRTTKMIEETQSILPRGKRPKKVSTSLTSRKHQLGCFRTASMSKASSSCDSDNLSSQTTYPSALSEEELERIRNTFQNKTEDLASKENAQKSSITVVKNEESSNDTDVASISGVDLEAVLDGKKPIPSAPLARLRKSSAAKGRSKLKRLVGMKTKAKPQETRTGNSPRTKLSLSAVSGVCVISADTPNSSKDVVQSPSVVCSSGEQPHQQQRMNDTLLFSGSDTEDDIAGGEDRYSTKPKKEPGELEETKSNDLSADGDVQKSSSTPLSSERGKIVTKRPKTRTNFSKHVMSFLSKEILDVCAQFLIEKNYPPIRNVEDFERYKSLYKAGLEHWKRFEKVILLNHMHFAHLYSQEEHENIRKAYRERREGIELIRNCMGNLETNLKSIQCCINQYYDP